MKHLKSPQELNEASENLNISDVIVRLFTDLARKHKVSVNDIDISLQGEELCVYIVNDVIRTEDGEFSEVERIKLNEL
jgi:hypothetical protein